MNGVRDGRRRRQRRSSSTRGTRCRGSLLSNLGNGTPTGKGSHRRLQRRWATTVATFGNHEFDWGQADLADRVAEATYPYVSANIVVRTTRRTARRPAGPSRRSSTDPYEIIRPSGPLRTAVKVAFIGVHDPGDADDHDRVGHRRPVLQGPGRVDPPLLRRDEGRRRRRRRRAQPSRATTDGGYGYGCPVYGDQTLAAEADHGRQAGEPDHRWPQPHRPHRGALSSAARRRSPRRTTTVAQVGRADVTVTPTGAVSVAWSSSTRLERRPGSDDRRPSSTRAATIPDYQALDQPGDRLDERADRRATTTATRSWAPSSTTRSTAT